LSMSRPRATPMCLGREAARNVRLTGFAGSRDPTGAARGLPWATRPTIRLKPCSFASCAAPASPASAEFTISAESSSGRCSTLRRKGIIAFLSKRRIPFIEDPSNANRHYTRVRIRLDLLPMLCRENPRIVDALLSLAQDARAIAKRAPAPSALDITSVSRRSAALIQRMAMQGQGTRRVSVRDGEVVVSYGNVRFRPRAGLRQDSSLRSGSPDSVVVEGPGTYRLPGKSEGRALKLEEGKHPAVPPTDAAIFDAALIGRPLQVRARRPGDRMRPRGGRGSRKVSDLLVDAKSPSRPAARATRAGCRRRNHPVCRWSSALRGGTSASGQRALARCAYRLTALPRATLVDAAFFAVNILIR